MESLEEWAEIMHNEIKITDFHRGWFSKHKNCFLGGEVFGWLLDKVVPDQKRARQYCQKMLDLKIIESVDNKTQFSLTDIYRFYFDSMDVADNLVRTWKQDVREAGEVATQLLAIAQELYDRAIISDEGGVGHTIDVELAL